MASSIMAATPSLFCRATEGGCVKMRLGHDALHHHGRAHTKACNCTAIHTTRRSSDVPTLTTGRNAVAGGATGRGAEPPLGWRPAPRWRRLKPSTYRSFCRLPAAITLVCLRPCAIDVAPMVERQVHRCT
jgi:hypothetical protein